MGVQDRSGSKAGLWWFQLTILTASATKPSGPCPSWAQATPATAAVPHGKKKQNVHVVGHSCDTGHSRWDRLSLHCPQIDILHPFWGKWCYIWQDVDVNACPCSTGEKHIAPLRVLMQSFHKTYSKKTRKPWWFFVTVGFYMAMSQNPGTLP